MGRLRIALPYLLVLAVVLVVLWSNQRPSAGDSAETPKGPMVDPVCKMQVNANWGHAIEHGVGHQYFCSEKCKQLFADDPDHYLAIRCLVCNQAVQSDAGVTATYMDKSYLLCSEAHRRTFKSDPAAYFMHRMWGIPDWLYYVSIAAVLLISFVIFEGKRPVLRRPRLLRGLASSEASKKTEVASTLMRATLTESLYTSGGAAAVALPALNRPAIGQAGHADKGCHSAHRDDRVDLMQWGWMRRLLMSRPFRCFVQLAVAAVFLLIIAAGLFGNQNPALNIAPLLTWTIWWCGLVVLIMFAGKAWCYMCPWEAMAFWTERLKLWKKTDSGGGLGLPWPRVLRNIWLATILFVALTWIELGFGVTMRPRATAYLAIAMLALAVVSAFLFDRKSFCRYGCLVGRVSGLYAMFAGLEVRHKNDAVCKNCQTKECVKGTERAYGCPTFEYPGKMATNTYCIQCTECLQACPHDNMAVNLRPWGSDLSGTFKGRSDEAYLALLMLAISGFHGLTMTPIWSNLVEAIEGWVPLGRIVAFSVAMAGLLAFPILIYAALVYLSFKIARASQGWSDEKEKSSSSYRDYFIRYAYCVLPIALFYHLAHNLEHLLMEGPKVTALASDPFGWGWNLLGTASWEIRPLISLQGLWILQVLLVTVGHVYSLQVAQRISRGSFANARAATRSQWPLLIGMIAFSIFSLWLLKQPMEMRTSAM